MSLSDNTERETARLALIPDWMRANHQAVQVPIRPPDLAVSGVAPDTAEVNTDRHEAATDAPAAVPQDRAGRVRGRLPLPELRPEAPRDGELVAAPGAPDRTADNQSPPLTNAPLCGVVLATCQNEPDHPGDHWSAALGVTLRSTLAAPVLHVREALTGLAMWRRGVGWLDDDEAVAALLSVVAPLTDAIHGYVIAQDVPPGSPQRSAAHNRLFDLDATFDGQDHGASSVVADLRAPHGRCDLMAGCPCWASGAHAERFASDRRCPTCGSHLVPGTGTSRGSLVCARWHYSESGRPEDGGT